MGRGAMLAVFAGATFVAAEASAASNVVQYSYDAAGNIVAIQRANPAPIAIAGFAPAFGAIGTSVTLTGTGFAATPAGNAVAFSGATAVVTAATSSTLTAVVPAAATSGRITVAVGANSASSPQDFMVTPSGAPTIAGFAPAAGAAGTPVSVTGTNFNPVPGATKVDVNQVGAAVSAVTATQLSIAIPAATGSGKLRVTTSAGSAVSTADFIVPPPGIAAADIAASVRLIANGSAHGIGILAFNKYGLILFDGNPGDWLSLQLSNFVINPAGASISYTVYKPDNTQLSAGTLTASNLTIHVPPLAAAGTYAILLRSATTQVSLDARLETNLVIPGDGSLLAVARSAGQSTRALIAAVAGEQKALMVAAMASLPAGARLDFELSLPNGSVVAKGTAFDSGGTSLLPRFTGTGTQAVVLTSPSSMTTASFQLALLAGVALPIDGPAQSVAITVPGAGARLNFSGTAGENLGLGITGSAPNTAPAINATLAVHKPDGTQLTTIYCYVGGTQCSGNFANLSATGSYTIIVQPMNGATGTLQVWLSHDVVGPLTSGVPTAVALNRPGQNGRLTFAASAGTLIALQVRGVASSPAGQNLAASILRPDGPRLAYSPPIGAGATIVAPVLPVAGTYTVFIEPDPNALGASTAAMEVLLDPGQSLVVDGPTVASTIAVAGGSARYTFAGTAGQNLGIGIGNLALNPVSDATGGVYAPDGTLLKSFGCSGTAGKCGVDLANLSATGTYGIVMQLARATGTLGATVSTDLAQTLTLGSASAISLDRPGRNARLTFAGTAGQTLRLSWTGVGIAGTTAYASAYLYQPNGSTLLGASLANGAAGGIDLPALPVSGTYTIFIDPPSGATMSVTLTLTGR
jgi:hypothetical protein